MKPVHKVIARTQERIIEFNAKYGLGLGFWIFLILTFVLGILFFSNINAFIQFIVSGYGYVGIFAITIILELLLQPIGPDVPLILGIISGLNPWIVLGAILAGAYIAIIIAYFAGRKIGAPGIEYMLGKKRYQNISKHEQQGKWFLVVGALTPIPYVPYLAGLWNLSVKDTMAYVVVPRTIRFATVLLLAYYLGAIVS